jgi:hypothetical protein
MTRCLDYQTAVRSVSGAPEIRQVTEIEEWRVEPELSSSRIVVSVIAADGSALSFLMAPGDAADMGEVLRRQTDRPEGR